MLKMKNETLAKKEDELMMLDRKLFTVYQLFWTSKVVL